MKWDEYLQFLVDVEQENVEENYRAGRAVNDSDAEMNAKIRRGFAALKAKMPVLLAATDMLASLKLSAEGLDFAQAQVESESDAYQLRKWLVQVKRVIAKAEGRAER